MSISQNDTGRAFEYGLALRLSTYLPATLQDGRLLQKAKRCFEACSQKEQQNIKAASNEVTAFLVAHDIRLSETGCSVYLQSDQLGQQGDVRDIIVHNATLNDDVGISAKNRHFAIKHSRLSGQIDFGFDWLGVHCSDQYFHTVAPIFEELRARQRKGEKWKDILNKKQLYYMPILGAFQSEMLALFAPQPAVAARALVQYLLGKFDYYKVIKENGTVSVMSFNTNGSLRWGSRLPMQRGS